VAIGATAESVRQALGSIGDANTFTIDARAYLPGLGPHHVVALRAAAGASSGNEFAGRTFLLGGPASAPDVLSFSSSAVSLLRGFPLDSFAGTHAAVVNADYRWPIARPERGHGTLPVFVRALYAGVFADAGNAWTQAFRAGDVKTSAGLELSSDILLGYSLPVTASAGVGWGHDGADQIPNSRTFYVRIGRAF
jgi:outer membrane protein assembly factor BamA